MRGAEPASERTVVMASFGEPDVCAMGRFGSVRWEAEGADARAADFPANIAGVAIAFAGADTATARATRGERLEPKTEGMKTAAPPL